MATIHLTTFIAAPAEVVFDLTRHVGLHKESMSAYNEEAVSGTRAGLIDKDETITWRARHFFKTRLLKMKVSELKKHELYVGEQSEGDFKMMKHEHYFKACENGTILIDLFHYEVPYGFIGRWFNNLYLTRYIKRLLEQRNKAIKECAESGKWKHLLS